MRYDRGNIRIVDCDHEIWDQESKHADDLLTFEDSIMDAFTSFIMFNVIDVFHTYIWGLFHVSSQVQEVLP